MKYHKRYKSYVLDIPVGSASATVAGQYAIDISSEFVVCSISGVNIDVNTAIIWDSNSAARWFSTPIVGNNFSRVYNALLRNPNTYLKPRKLPANTTVYFEFTDDGATYATPYTAQVVLHGYDLVPVDDSFVTPELALNMATQFRIYPAQANRAANQVIREILRIDKSKFFVITEILANSTGTFEVMFSDTRFSNPWSNSRVASQAITGTAQHPFTLPVPIIFEKNTSIFYDVRDTSGSANTIQLAFNGFEVL